jgi:hypothetical protein
MICCSTPREQSPNMVRWWLRTNRFYPDKLIQEGSTVVDNYYTS